ncbi:hypothetical protein BDN72DRAFT_131906 [Pluteus cervinus]|uniref:Uncharacterized protein n=1 Tax=Pluteus cervinus TaxID=181527 RepID=A0ACD3AM68_9AGAR|nr:hypothetical protein BDN72DRAFT_131906 [Pluteus cervinus]
MFSLFLRSKLYIGEACWAFLFGVIVGPYGANVLNPHAWADTEAGVNNIVLEFTRVVLAIGVFAIGVELPKAYMRRHWKSLFFLLCPVMTWGWFVSAALIYALIPGLSFLSSLAVAACLTPTDPILAAAVVGGKWADKHVPTHIRHLLAAESACNDGAAFPFLFIALYLLLDGSTGDAIRDWFLLLWLYQVVVGVIVGSLIGIGFRYLMKFCERKELIDRHSYVAQYLSLAMLTIGVCTLLGSDDLLAAFACGTAFAWDGFFNHQTEESNFSSVIDLLFNIAAFIFLGAWMPFGSFQDEKLTLSVWRLIVIAILVLFLRRLPIMVALYKWIPDVKTFREAVFSGHFGPIGVGAIFISTLAVETIHSSNKKNEELELLAATIQPITAFMVLCSITIHGLSIPGFSLGRRVHTVTRTWSRSAVVLGSGGPEWMNQTRPVKRPEDIVINRDHMNAMELGMAPQRDIEKAEVSTIDASMTLTQINSRPHSLKGTGSVDGSALMSGSTTTEASGSGSAAGTTPPASTEGQTADGDERMDQSGAVPPTNSGGGDGGDETEWREGRHRVVERRGGPGEDVSVRLRYFLGFCFCFFGFNGIYANVIYWFRFL